MSAIVAVFETQMDTHERLIGTAEAHVMLSDDHDHAWTAAHVLQKIILVNCGAQRVHTSVKRIDKLEVTCQEAQI